MHKLLWKILFAKSGVPTDKSGVLGIISLIVKGINVLV